MTLKIMHSGIPIRLCESCCSVEASPQLFDGSGRVDPAGV